MHPVTFQIRINRVTSGLACISPLVCFRRVGKQNPTWRYFWLPCQVKRVRWTVPRATPWYSLDDKYTNRRNTSWYRRNTIVGPLVRPSRASLSIEANFQVGYYEYTQWHSFNHPYFEWSQKVTLIASNSLLLIYQVKIIFRSPLLPFVCRWTNLRFLTLQTLCSRRRPNYQQHPREQLWTRCLPSCREHDCRWTLRSIPSVSLTSNSQVNPSPIHGNRSVAAEVRSGEQDVPNAKIWRASCITRSDRLFQERSSRYM